MEGVAEVFHIGVHGTLFDTGAKSVTRTAYQGSKSVLRHCYAAAVLFGGVQELRRNLGIGCQHCTAFVHCPTSRAVIVHIDFGCVPLRDVGQINGITELGHSLCLQVKYYACAVGRGAVSSKAECHGDSIQGRYRQHLIYSVDFSIKLTHYDGVIHGQAVLTPEYHDAGLVEIVTHMFQHRGHRFGTIDIPVIVIDLGHPDLCAFFNLIKHAIQAAGFTQIKHRDIHIIHVDIAGTRQCDVGRCIQRGGKYIGAGQSLAFAPHIV